MIELASGNILDANVEALVNTVNCVGVMGKGIALQFKQAYPDNYEVYRRACERHELQPGKMLVYDRRGMFDPRYIVNFPTKRHWRGKSRIEDIELGLAALAEEIRRLGITSVAVPPLGCGSGGLNWDEIQPLIERMLAPLEDVRVLLFTPHGAPDPEKMTVATKRPTMTLGRAVLLALFESYSQPMYRLTMLEAQKLAYLAQAAGVPLRLRFAKARYGPYADNLHHALQSMEGHFIRGYGDRSQGASIRRLPGAAAEARAFLTNQPETQAQLERVTRLIEGFETPYGMELLATVHWVVQSNPSAKQEARVAIDEVRAWSPRKRASFHPSHIKAAWKRLHDQGWL